MYLTIPVQDMSYLTMRMRTFNHHKMQQDVTLISHRVNLFQLHHFCMHLLFPAMHPSISLLFYGNQAAIPLPCCNLFLILTYYCRLDQLLITVNVQEEESGDNRPTYIAHTCTYIHVHTLYMGTTYCMHIPLLLMASSVSAASTSGLA